MSKLPFESMDRSLVIKKDILSSGKFGKRPEDRSTDEMLKFGMINIDKPAGQHRIRFQDTSRIFCIWIRLATSGTLDPGVTGVLLLVCRIATRIMQSL